jgi:hypothetical protein
VEKKIAEVMPVELYPVEIDAEERESAEYIKDRYPIHAVTT